MFLKSLVFLLLNKTQRSIDNIQTVNIVVWVSDWLTNFCFPFYLSLFFFQVLLLSLPNNTTIQTLYQWVTSTFNQLMSLLSTGIFTQTLHEMKTIFDKIIYRALWNSPPPISVINNTCDLQEVQSRCTVQGWFFSFVLLIITMYVPGVGAFDHLVWP